jgi:hypothetical protein
MGPTELLTDGCLIERFSAKAEVVEFSTVRSRWCAANAADLAIDRHQINQ